MAVQNIARKVGPMTGNGILKEFPFSFKAIRPTDVVVKVATGDKVTDEELTPVYGVDYTVALNSDQDEKAGGVVIFTEPPEDGSRVAITSDTVIDQQLVLTNHDGFLPESLNDAYDKLTIICQELKDCLSRCLIVPITSEKTPQEVMSDLLDVANKAADYAKRAEDIFNAVQNTGRDVATAWQEIQETKGVIDAYKAAVDLAVKRAEEILARAEVIGKEVDALVPHLPDLIINRDHIDEIHRVGSDLRGFEVGTVDLGSITDSHIDTETIVTEGYIKKVADHIDDCIHPVAENLETIENVDNNMQDVRTVANDLQGLSSPTLDLGSVTEPIENIPVPDGGYLKQVSAISDDIAALGPKAADITTVAVNIEDVKTAASVAESLEETKRTVLKANAEAGFSFRYMADAIAGITAPQEEVTPSVRVKVGDHVVNQQGDYFEVEAVDAEQETVTLSQKRGSFKGEKGDRGEGLQVKRAFVNEDELFAAFPEGDELGDLYLAGLSLYLCVEKEIIGIDSTTKTKGWEYLGDLVGPQGDIGETPIISVAAKGLPAGSDPKVVKTGTSEAPVFTFSIPKGDKGDTGQTPVIGLEVQILSEDQEPSVEKSGTAEEPNFILKIPRGLTGERGPIGDMPDLVDLGGLEG